MNLKKLTIAPMLALALFAVGCGEDATCESVCEDRKDCDNATAQDKALDCAEVCGDDMKTFNENLGCQEEYDAMIECGTEADDVCDEKACKKQGDAYGACIAAACEANPTDCLG